MKKTAEQVIKTVKDLDTDLGIWRTHWQELYDYILPRKNNVVTKTSPGTKKGVQLFDNTAMVACDLLAGALHGMLTNPNQIWFELKAGSPELDNIKEVKEYLQELTRRMHDVLNRSNFQTEVHELYLDLCCIGTATMIIEEDDDSIVNFSTRFIDEIKMVENSKGRVQEVYREWKWNAARIYEEYGKGVDETSEEQMTEKFGRQIWDAYKKQSSDKFCLIQAVYKEHIHPVTKPKFMFVSQTIIKETKKEVKVGGYRTYPYVTPRWTKVAGEVYGRSPGMNALPEAKTLNLIAKTVVKGAQKTVDPPLQMADDGVVSFKRTMPGSIHYYRAGSKDRIEPIYNDARIDFGFQVARDRQAQIKSAFFVDRLNLVENDRMTTVETNQRIEEQFRFLGPMLGRQQSEFLKPMITRTLDIMVSKDVDGDLIGNPPDELGDVELDVIYTSPIARSQRMDQGQTMLRAWEASKLAFEMFPDAVDLVDGDEFVRHAWDIFGGPQKVLQGEQEVDAIREARANAQKQMVEQQQKQEQLEQAGQEVEIAGAVQQQQQG